MKQNKKFPSPMVSNGKNRGWFEESQEKSKLGFRIQKKLQETQSSWQKIEVFETLGHGRMLVHDGFIMLTERDEFIYHDMMAHLPLYTHPSPQNVLVIGGGDGGTVREVLNHKSIKKCTLVEIDKQVIEICKKWFPHTSCQLDNPRVEVLIQDGVDFVKNTSEKFDVILVDSSDPVGPAAPLFNVDFYQNIKKRLQDPGIVVSQAESPYYDMECQRGLVKTLTQVFPKVHLYNYSNMSYLGGLWSFSFASQGLCPFLDLKPERICQKHRYYSYHSHLSSLLIPQFMSDTYREYLSPIPLFHLSF